jgi:hypothetical protein
MFGCGEYVLKKSHQHLRCTADDWGKMTVKQRKSALSKCFRILDSKSSRHVVSTDGTFAVLQSPSAGKKKIIKRVDAEQIALEPFLNSSRLSGRGAPFLQATRLHAFRLHFSSNYANSFNLYVITVSQTYMLFMKNKRKYMCILEYNFLYTYH